MNNVGTQRREVGKRNGEQRERDEEENREVAEHENPSGNKSCRVRQKKGEIDRQREVQSVQLTIARYSKVEQLLKYKSKKSFYRIKMI